MNDTTIKQWNDAAAVYAEEQERSAYADTNRRIVKERFRKLSGERVLDLGCGYGWYTEYFRKIGGHAFGIDGAQTMIDIAGKRYPNCTFDLKDITKPLDSDDNAFDIVFCNQVLMDIEDIELVFSECGRILRPGGVFWYSIVHPAFFNGDWQCDETGRQFGKLVSSYITPGVSENLFWGKTMHFHRPIYHYLNAAADAGLILTHAEEPRTYDGIVKNDDLPLFFIAEYKKPYANDSKVR